MHGVRAAIPQTDPLAKAEFTTIRERLIKICARVIERIARNCIRLPTSCPEEARFRAVAFCQMPQTCCTANHIAPIQRARSTVGPIASTCKTNPHHALFREHRLLG